MKVITVINGVPLLRDLNQCRRKDHAAASVEVIWLLFFATLPIWLGIGVVWLLNADISKFLHEFFHSGEVLLISCALIGPSMYVITKKYGDLPERLSIHFPQATFLGLVSFGISLLTAGIVGVLRAHAQMAVADTEKVQSVVQNVNVDRMETLSIFVLIATILTLYVVSVFKSFAEDGAPSEMRTDTANYVKKFKNWKKPK